MSLAIHLIGVLGEEETANCPFATYIFDLDKASHDFMLASPANERGMILHALGAAHTVYKCSCGFVYFVADCGMTNESGKCPKCGKNIGNQAGAAGHTAAPGQQRMQDRPVGGDEVDSRVPDQAGYVNHLGSDLDSSHYTLTRVSFGQTPNTLSATVFRIMHCLVHLSLFIGEVNRCLHQTSSSEETSLQGLMQGQLDQSYTHPLEQCWQHALKDILILHQLLPSCTTEGLAAFMHKLVADLPVWCNKSHDEMSGRLMLDQPTKRNNWESGFEKFVLRLGLSKLQVTGQELVASFADTSSPTNELHQLIDEASEIRKELKPNIFRVIACPSNAELTASFFSGTSALKHGFLRLLLQRDRILTYVQWLWPLVHWERFLRDNYSRKLTRREAQERTVHWLLHEREQDRSVVREGKRIFKTFITAWNAILSALRDDPAMQERYTQEMGCRSGGISAGQLVDYKLKEKDCKICVGCVDKKDISLVLPILTKMLAKIQNEFLFDVIKEVPKSSALRALSLGGDTVNMGPPLTLGALTESNVLHLTKDFAKVLHVIATARSVRQLNCALPRTSGGQLLLLQSTHLRQWQGHSL